MSEGKKGRKYGGRGGQGIQAMIRSLEFHLKRVNDLSYDLGPSYSLSSSFFYPIPSSIPDIIQRAHPGTDIQRFALVGHS